jgi:ABC-2 type transport system ATP-binding protein
MQASCFIFFNDAVPAVSCPNIQHSMKPVIRVNNLTKQFNQVEAVNDLSFTVNEGEVYGFLGQNGAGKSTTIRMLLTLVQPTAGSIEIFGKNLYSHRSEVLRQTGAIIEKPDLYKYLTAFENLSVFARLSGVKYPGQKKLMEQLEMVGLAERAHSKVKTFSQGMKQRLGIAVALVHDPRLIILDEPTNGLDPQGIADIRNLVRHLSRDRGKTVFVSSHLLNEIEQVSDRLLILDKGKKVVEGSIHELVDPSNAFIELNTADNNACYNLLKQSQTWNAFNPTLQVAHVGLRMPVAQVPQLVAYLVQQGVQVYSLRQKNSLEAYFLSLIAGK